MIDVEMLKYKLSIDKESGSVLSFTAKDPSQEFIASNGAKRPLFTIQCRDEAGKPKQYSSFEAEKVDSSREAVKGGVNIQLGFSKLKGQSIEVKVGIFCPSEEFITKWSISIDNYGPEFLEWIDFPNIVVPVQLSGGDKTERLLWPYGEGVLISDIKKANLADKDTMIHNNIAGAGYIGGRNRPCDPQYPGQVTSQLMAYYNDKAGLYIATYDTRGTPKLIEPLRTDDGVELAFIHFLGGEQDGAELDYETMLGIFHGDWYEAAEIYRQWAQRQEWCLRKLRNRNDVPKWWLESPIAVAFPLRGHTDFDDPSPNPDYMPLPNSIPYLEQLSKKLDSPLLPIPACWEKQGPWVTPDSFPPYGGEDHVKEFFHKLAEHKWHGGMYCSGTRWVIYNQATGYDGRVDFLENGGEDMVCRLPNNELWLGAGDLVGRASYRCCVHQSGTKKEILRQCEKLISYGCDFLQILDQNLGSIAFSCYAPDHGHPRTPGVWMTEAMKELLESMWVLCEKSDREIGLSVEGPPAEVYIPYYAFADGRPNWAMALGESIPLYQFLYHEYIQILHGSCGNIKGPDVLLFKTASAFIFGDTAYVELSEKAQLHRAWNLPWGQEPLDQESTIKLMRRANQLRRGPGKEYLIFGRMIKPFPVRGVPQRSFSTGTGSILLHQMPAVPTSAWMSRDGTIGQVLINYTRESHKPVINIEGSGSALVKIHKAEDQEELERELSLPHELQVDMSPLSVALIEICLNTK